VELEADIWKGPAEAQSSCDPGHVLNV
jgi:hypothetical protein